MTFFFAFSLGCDIMRNNRNDEKGRDMWVIFAETWNSEVDLYCVGFFTPSGEFKVFKETDSQREAMKLCSFLNGGNVKLNDINIKGVKEEE